MANPDDYVFTTLSTGDFYDRANIAEPFKHDFILDSKYKLTAVIGSGSWGKVYKATDLALETELAVKVVHKHLLQDEPGRNRFLREAILLSRIESSRVGKILGHGLFPVPYVASEYFDGVPLNKWLELNGHMNEQMGINFFMHLCEGLKAAESLRVIHGNLKPANILIKTSGAFIETKILDFGLSKFVDQTKGSDKLSSGELLGSSPYMAPEAWKGECDTRSDIYSLGCIMYEVFAGKSAYTASSHIDYMNKHLTEEPGRFSDMNTEEKIPAALEDIVRKCMQKSNVHRYQTSSSCFEDLKKIKFGKQPVVILPEDKKAIPSRVLLIAGLALILLLPATYFVMSSGSKKNGISAGEVRAITATAPQEIAQSSSRAEAPHRISNSEEQVGSEPAKIATANAASGQEGKAGPHGVQRGELVAASSPSTSQQSRSKGEEGKGADKNIEERKDAEGKGADKNIEERKDAEGKGADRKVEERKGEEGKGADKKVEERRGDEGKGADHKVEQRKSEEHKDEEHQGSEPKVSYWTQLEELRTSSQRTDGKRKTQKTRWISFAPDNNQNAQIQSPAEIEKVLRHSKLLDGGQSLNAQVTGNLVTVSTYCRTGASDQDCKIDSVFILKELIEHFKTLDSVHMDFYEPKIANQYRAVEVSKEDLSLIEAGRPLKSVLGDIVIIDGKRAAPGTTRQNGSRQLLTSTANTAAAKVDAKKQQLSATSKFGKAGQPQAPVRAASGELIDFVTTDGDISVFLPRSWQVWENPDPATQIKCVGSTNEIIISRHNISSEGNIDKVLGMSQRTAILKMKGWKLTSHQKQSLHSQSGIYEEANFPPNGKIRTYLFTGRDHIYQITLTSQTSSDASDTDYLFRKILDSLTVKG